jgi:glycosyltransferase involved in cell wall biosynthesis
MTNVKPLRILHTVSSERWTGVAEPVVSLARRQEELGHAVWLACTPGQSFERKARIQGVRVIDQLRLDRRGILAHLRDIAALRRLVKRHRIDIIHAHLLNDHWLSALAFVGHRRRHLLVRTFHKVETPRIDRWHRWLFCAKTDQAIATSHQLKQLISEKLALANGELAVVAGAVNTERFHPELDGSSIRSELDLPPDAPVAGFVARMSPQRGHLWLLDSLPAVYRALPEARIILVGRGPLKPRIRGRIALAPHAGKTIWAGYRTEDLPETCAAMDIALFLGQGSEGSNRSILEAMAAGRPVIALNSGAAPDYLEDGVNGLLVPPGDCQALSEAILALLGNLPRAREMGRRARATVEQRFTEQARAQKTIDVYRAALQKKIHSSKE